jgi:hypothetical protein
MTTVVTISRRKDPLDGQRVQVLGRLRRHGQAELLVVLPDGSKRMIPRTWTDAEPTLRVPVNHPARSRFDRHSPAVPAIRSSVFTCARPQRHHDLSCCCAWPISPRPTPSPSCACYR